MGSMKSAPTTSYQVIEKPIFGIHGNIDDTFFEMKGAQTSITLKRVLLLRKATVNTSYKHLPTLKKNGYGFTTEQAVRNALTPRAVTSLKAILYFVLASASFPQINHILDNELFGYINIFIYFWLFLVVYLGTVYRGKP